MGLADNFQFSQANLQDFVDCRRRFQLRYLQHVHWPAVETEPVLENEYYLRQGALFHRMIQQHLLGVPGERLYSLVKDENLGRWWQNFLAFAQNLEGRQDLAGLHPEVTLSAPLGEHSLLAKCDLVITQNEGRAEIYDWKTSRKLPKRKWLADRLQTRVYPYLLVRGGTHLNGGEPILPVNVEMIYWFADFPAQPERFPYSLERYQADEKYLTGLVERIANLSEDDFPLTEDVRACRFCVYRSLCDRGVRAGSLSDLEGDLEADAASDRARTGDLELDFDQIAEVEF